MKKLYVNPQSRIELAQMPQMMEASDFLGIATVSGGGSAYCPPASSGD